MTISSQTHGDSRRRAGRVAAPARAGAAAAAMAVVLSLGAASPAVCQENASAAGAGPVSPDSADAIRASLERPPGEPPFDAYDAIGLPFRVIVFPIALVGRGIAETIGVVTRLARPREVSIFDKLDAIGVHPGFGPIGPRSGAAGRLLYTGLDPFYFETAFSIRESQRHTAGLLLSGSNYRLDASYRFSRYAEPHFWGIGPESRREDESDYRWDRQVASISATIVLSPLRLLGGVAYEDNRVARGFDHHEQDLQDSRLADGLFGLSERTKYAVLSLGGSIDGTRVAGGFQRRGIYVEAGSDIYRGVADTDSRFHRFRGAANGYLPLNELQSLALRGIAEVQEVDEGPDVPFTHLASLGGDRAARAYRTDRFRDRALLGLMSEWRYEIWRELHERGRAEMFLLFDAGTVAPDFAAARVDETRLSYGFGSRLNWGGDVLWQAYLAFGEEGARFSMDFNWMF